MKSRILFLLLLPLFMSCDSALYEVQTGQKVLFQFEQSNYAWGQFQRGWFIDSEGYVRAYKQPQNWLYPDQSNHISKSDMDANVLNADSVCFRIDASDLAKKVELIKKASEGKMTDPVNRMADFGGISYSCFTFNTEKQTYQSFLLSQTGDVEIQNTSKEAKTLYEWLKEVNQQVVQ
jgi:hypothetical protein